ncbi:hypothetical protein M1N86_00930 [Dehalococcoidia bacterium]|nr:hypothetical protein [Dehalococcoidia bacterium]MCL0087919.1 hypothetical protein [Dehalococcoidia bacterium]
MDNIATKRIQAAPPKLNRDKALAAIGFIFILLALVIIAITPPATGYEISIYEAYPPYFWFLVILAIASGIVILVSNSFAEEPSRWWIAGFAVILYTNLVILLLPIARGYATFGRGDVLSHIGFTKDILFTGHFASAGEAGANHYPVIHILLTNLSHVTGLTPELLVMIVPIFFTLFYMVSVYLLSRVIATTRGQAMLITAFGSLLLFKGESTMLASSIQCFFMLPITLLLYFKVRRRNSNSLAYSILFVLLLLLTPFFHPGEGTLFLITIFLGIELSLLLYRMRNKLLSDDAIKIRSPLSGISINPSMILFVCWFTWFASFAVFHGTVRSIWHWFVYEIGKPTAVIYADILERAGLSVYEFMELFLNMWGHVVIYCLAGALVSIVVWKKFLSSKGKIDSGQFIFSFLFIIFASLIFVTFFADVWLGYNRAMRYVIFAATILNGLGLYVLFHNRHNQIGMFIIILLLMTSVMFGTFNTFVSPITRGPNFQVTGMEIRGMDWFLDHRNDSLLIYEKGLSQSRFSHALYGFATPLPNIRCPRIAIPPDHFGYPEYNKFGELFIDDKYFIESKLSRIASPEIHPEFEHLWRFTPEDFYRMDNTDRTVNRIFSNGEFWVSYIHGMRTTSP